MPRHFRSFSSNSSNTHSNARKFLTGILYFMLISASLTGGQRLSQAESTKLSKEPHFPNTLPLTSFYDAPHPLPMGKPGELIRSEPSNQYSIPYELSVSRILYHSRTSHGEDVAVSGVVLIPDGKPPAGGWPVVAWAHEFRGMARQCAPTLMRNLGVGPLLAMYANLGYAVVATDYAGLGSDSGRSVEDMESNALDVIYSVAAARAAVKEIGVKWIAVGAFQGALASTGVAENEIRDPGYRGSIVTSGLADAHSRYQRLGEDSSARMMLVLASTLKTLYPEFQLSDMLTDAALPAYKHAEESCGADVDLGFNTEMITPGWENDHFVKDFFLRSSPGQKMANGPLLVISGELDKVVSLGMTTKTVDRMCKKGDRVLFLKYPNLDASGVMGASAADQISWIKARFAGDAAPSNCH
jgi:Secretory lipase